MKIVKKILIVLLLVLVIAQFFGPDKNESDLEDIKPFLTETNPPKDVLAILETTCYDCHSSNTTYPWYNNITPVNYWLDSHIEEGKEHFNMSDWNSYSLKKKDHKLDELIEEVEEGEMPLNSYTYTHGDANLTPEQIKKVTEWAKNVRAFYSIQMEVPQ
ncbi:heme-binding domain-containing protein [Aurantibacter aestuarii]|uniref:Cytochrome C n=1 Tax=Aurantibacter aestuarii TaxID=1266046 RepID=A0A2T1N5E1_9FLAO|nr:heme-binding domain-containing protein [Aurantibacter aestuarii]PSG86501.1 cytochrome C [Aurantibacter aestuarii]